MISIGSQLIRRITMRDIHRILIRSVEPGKVRRSTGSDLQPFDYRSKRT